MVPVVSKESMGLVLPRTEDFVCYEFYLGKSQCLYQFWRNMTGQSGYTTKHGEELLATIPRLQSCQY
jgi:hypothetical protein